MKCHGCSSSMLLDRQETAGRVTTEWHRCPVCNKVTMHSELDQSSKQESRWADPDDLGSDKSTVAYARRQGIAYA